MFHNKASAKYKPDTNTENKGQKAIKYIENKQQETKVSPSISTITLNVNGLNFLIKRQRMSERIRKMNNLYVTYKRVNLDAKT